MNTQNLIAGITILQKYRDSSDGYDLGAEHDAIYAFPTDKPISQEDVAKLIELGWSQEDVECDEFTVVNYDPEESWCAYV